MAATRETANQADLEPPNWVAIRLRYEAGILTVRAIGREYGVTHRAITQKALKEQWTRALAPAIQAKAEAILVRESRNQQRAARVVDRDGRRAERDLPKPERAAAVTDVGLVDHGAQMVAQIKRQHRGIVERSRSLAETLLQELAAVTNAPELFGQVHMLLEGGDEVPVAMLRRVAEAVESLPARARTLSVLVDAVRSLIGAEREAYGMSAQDGTGRPLAVVKDYTGTGDPDAPPQQDDDDE